jgi:hypothetical protein
MTKFQKWYSLFTKSWHETTFKDKLDLVQRIVTTAAILIGGLWTYNIFIKEREQYPHAIIELKLSHVMLSERVNLLRVGIEISNTGKSLMQLGSSIVRIQQVLPFLPCPNEGPCAATEVGNALNEVERQADHFTWALIAERNSKFNRLNIEPGEKQEMEFEFAISPEIKVVRVYSYFRNGQNMEDGNEIGWAASRYYDLRELESKGEKK